MRTVLIVSQVYVPDPASVGQHMADAAAELARRGFRVIVLTSRRGYDDPRQVYPAYELRDGVEVRRLPASSFGKRSIAVRVLGGLVFLLQAVLRALFMRRLDALLVSTSPPMCFAAAWLIGALRRVPVVYWVMDINPDQAVALAQVRPDAWSVRVFEALNRRVLSMAAKVVTLDRFMAERLQHKADLGGRLEVIPPWPLVDQLRPEACHDNPFRRQHGLVGKRVFMYSGNLSLAHPIEPMFRAMLHFTDRPDVVFLFVGGGAAKEQLLELLERHQPQNIRYLPYQPLETLQFSLSAADVHLVTMGEQMVGIVHPCKIYGAMACARPVLLFGPRNSHLGELIQRYRIGWQVDHADAAGAIATIQEILDTDQQTLVEMGRRARAAIDSSLARHILCGRFCDVVQEVVCGGRAQPCTPENSTTVPDRSSGDDSASPCDPSSTRAAL
jgi:colanic acid biosynthesis glycosyl transferase WcaI